MASFLGLAAQRLDGIGHIVRLVCIRLTKGRSPREIFVHVLENRRELHHGLYAGIPVLFVDFLGKFVALEPGMPLHPAFGLNNFGGLRGIGDNVSKMGGW